MTLRLNLILFSSMILFGSATAAHAQIPVKLSDVGNPQWAAQCGQPGGYGACENLADQNLKGKGVPASRHMTAYYLLQACKYGKYEMCEFAYGMAEKQPESNFILGEASLILCEKSNPQYCAVPYTLFSKQDKPNYMPELVGKALEKGCDKGDVYSCSLSGPWYDDYKPPKGVTPNLTKALNGYSRSCKAEPGSNPNLDKDDISSMCYFTYKYSTELKLPSNYQDISEEAFIRSCEFSSSSATCETAMSSFFHGINDVRKSDSKALRVAQGACDLGASSGCEYVANSLYQKKDYASALGLYSASCDTSPSLNTCKGAALTAFEAKGLKNAMTTKYAQLACEQGDGWSCYVYGSNTFYLTSDGNRSFFQKACDLDFQQGCDEVVRQKEQAARNVQINEYNERVYNQQMSPPSYTPTPTWDDYMRAGQAYWSNWKPSYCSNRSITSRDGRTTTRAECADY